MIQIFLNTILGQTIPIQIPHNSTLKEFKEQIHQLTGIKNDEQFISYGLNVLDNDELAIENYGIENFSTISQNLKLLGGGKKRKKKTFSKPKKIKHKKKKVKLAVLKFYKVDGSDKISRLRKECLSCGPGIFMAMHHNRNYCGRCGVSYIQKAVKET